VVLARHVADATSSFGRESLARLCSMALREGGVLLAELYLPTDDDPEWMVGQPDLDEFTTLLREAGAKGVRTRMLGRKERPTARVVGEW
jgi:nitrous oxide reductase accessory protein NosL